MLSGGQTSAANLMATFQIDFNGELKVHVFGEEFTATPVSKPQYDIDKKPAIEKIKNKELYLNVAYLASNLYGAVWDSNVSGKPVKFKKSG